MRKKLLIVFGILVVVVVAGGAILVFNLEKIVNSKKDVLLARAESELGREVSVGDIGVTFSGGIGVRLDNVGIADDAAFSTDAFVRADNLTIQVKLLPLLKKNVEVKRLVLNKPIITVIRSEDGRLNYETLTPLSKTREASGEPDSPAEPGSRAGAAARHAPAAALPLVLAFADIEQGEIRFVDKSEQLELTARKINLTVKNFSLDETVSISLSAAVLAEKEDLSLEGSVGPVGSFETVADLRDVPVSVELKLGPFDVDDIRRVAPNHPKLNQLELTKTGNITGAFDVSGTAGALEVTRAELRAAVLGAAQPNLSLRASAGPVDATDAANALSPALRLKGEFELAPASLANARELSGSVGVAPEGLEVSGDGSAVASFEGTAESMRVKTKLDLTGGSIRLADKFDKPAGVPLTATADAVLSRAGLDIESSELVLSTFSLTASGKVGLEGELPVVDLSIRSGKADVSGWSELLPMLAQFAAAGTVSLNADVEGPVGGGVIPRVQGTLGLADGSAKVAQLPQPVSKVNATVNFSARDARLDNATFQVGRSAVRVDGQASRLTPLEATYKIISKELYRTDFQVVPGKPSPRPEVLNDVAVEGRLWQDGEALQHVGTASSSRGVLANLDYQDLKASIKSDEEKMLIEKFSVKSLGGTLEGTGAYEYKKEPPRFELDTKVRSVNLAEYFQYKFESLTQVIEGRIDLDMNVAGQGKTWEDIQPSLKGAGGAIVLEGALLNVNIAQEAISGLKGIPMIDSNALTRFQNKYPNLFGAKNKTLFKNLKGEVTISDGKINSGDIVLTAKDFSIQGKGWFSFDKKIDMNTKLVLSNQMTQDIIKEVSAAKYILNKEGRIEVPLSFAGDVIRPTVILDTETLARRIQQSLVDQGVGEARDKLKDQVKDIFSGFGKKKTAKEDTTRSR